MVEKVSDGQKRVPAFFRYRICFRKEKRISEDILVCARGILAFL